MGVPGGASSLVALLAGVWLPAFDLPGLPKTRSGKIMRRLLRKVAEGETSNLGDVTTLLDPAVVAQIVAGRK